MLSSFFFLIISAKYIFLTCSSSKTYSRSIKVAAHDLHICLNIFAQIKTSDSGLKTEEEIAVNVKLRIRMYHTVSVLNMIGKVSWDQYFKDSKFSLMFLKILTCLMK